MKQEDTPNGMETSDIGAPADTHDPQFHVSLEVARPRH